MTNFRQVIVILTASLCSVMSVFDGFEYEVPALSNVKTNYLIQNYAGFGTYKYGYDTGSGPGQSFKQEERAENGTVRGRWGYIDPYGNLRVTEYLADATGYHILHRRIVNLHSEEPIVKPPRPVKRPPGPFIGPLPPFIHRPRPEEI
ncbi:cuticle protein 6-like [Limulus polyphemus]|uniref:Cuticle protein 6-like n=1 Tax=Limulus polyphemus TaxID=6850 RepID=A0ABM1C5P9_LIMPO|nr:cuticle protein 6-like [Limulus polyphemus]